MPRIDDKQPYEKEMHTQGALRVAQRGLRGSSKGNSEGACKMRTARVGAKGTYSVPERPPCDGSCVAYRCVLVARSRALYSVGALLEGGPPCPVL